jgi:chemotaxis protein CheY-P-specific phosphatase CheC
MLNEETREKISESFCDVLEKMAFMFGELIGTDDLPPAGDKYYRTHMSFKGAMNGSLAMAVPEQMCAEVAANVLGVDLDSEMADEQSCDALKELLNVACGNILIAIAGEEPLFDLQPPEIELIGKDRWRTILDDEDTLAFNVDENPVLLNLKLTTGKA